jgi:uncharacterized protein YndB with AHSA1/START domain
MNQEKVMQPLFITREFPVSREQVFAAWTKTEAVKAWFCPDHFTVPEALVECRVGGAFEICMRSPQGQQHWTKGHFVEIIPNRRLVIDMHALGDDGKPLFGAYTEVNFADASIGTRVEVTQTYTLLSPLADSMVRGAPMGWSQTLAKLSMLLSS